MKAFFLLCLVGVALTFSFDSLFSTPLHVPFSYEHEESVEEVSIREKGKGKGKGKGKKKKKKKKKGERTRKNHLELRSTKVRGQGPVAKETATLLDTHGLLGGTHAQLPDLTITISISSLSLEVSPPIHPFHPSLPPQTQRSSCRGACACVTRITISSLEGKASEAV